MADGTTGGPSATHKKAPKGRASTRLSAWLVGPLALLVAIAATHAVLLNDLTIEAALKVEAKRLFKYFDYSACFFAAVVVAPKAYTVLRAEGWNRVGCAAWAILVGWLCANGGGAIWRNSFEVTVPFPWGNPEYNLIAMAGGLTGLAMLKVNALRRQSIAATFLDVVCSGVFVCLGAAAASRMAEELLVAAALAAFFAMISAYFGGVTADLLRLRVPAAFTGLGWLAALTGGVVHIHLSHLFATTPALWAYSEWVWVITITYVGLASSILGKIKLKR